MSNPQSALLRSVLQLIEWRSRVERFSTICSQEQRAMVERWFAPLWLNVSFTVDAVAEFEKEVDQVDERYQ